MRKNTNFQSFQVQEDLMSDSTNLADMRQTHKLNTKTANKKNMVEKKYCCN